MDSKKKITGGKNSAIRRMDKRLAWKGGDFSATGIAADEKTEKRKTVKALGGNTKVKAQKIRFIAITGTGNKTSKAEVLSVIENKANRQYARQNTITKGAIIKIKFEGKEAKAKVTSRPGQSGTVQAVLIQ
ncbi:MAG: 30S ribosomal protein S8e [Candidatus ainarchaeum sp.]|nr:30S ribosomal protein S8e [Candidatus ainarchaeum sp.]